MLAKNVGKESTERSAKNVFYIHTNIVTKKWRGKNSRNNFYRRTRIVREKNVGIKIVGKKCEKCFLYSYESRDQKKLGKKTRETIFPETHEMCEHKMLGKKSSEKVPKNVFNIHTIIITKKWEEIRAKQFFQKQTNCASKKLLGKKSSEKSAKQRFLN